MEQHNRKYNFRFGDKKLVFNKEAHDPEFNVYAKALAYAMYHKQYPTIRSEAKVDDRYPSDLTALDYDGKMLLWVECGKTSMDKVEKLFKKYRQAKFVFVQDPKDMTTFTKHLDKCTKDMRSLPPIDIVLYPDHFADWWVSEEGDVFIPREEVTILSYPLKGRLKV